MKNENLIACSQITKTYLSGEVTFQALKGIDLQIKIGECVAIMGTSGSGKSTLMNIVGCMDRATSGSYLLDGQETNNMNTKQMAGMRNQKIGFIFQRYNLLSRISVLDNVMLPLQYAGIDGKEAELRSMEALEQVGLKDLTKRCPNQMSGGQQQRVAIARAIVKKPLLLLADEPTGALDTKTSVDVMNLLLRVQKEQGSTLVIVTHDPDIATYCQRLVRVRDGLLVEDEMVKISVKESGGDKH